MVRIPALTQAISKLCQPLRFIGIKLKEHNNLRKILTALVITFGCLSFFSLIMCVGGGGVINDLYSALEEIEELEKKNLLDNPPETISSIAKREIKLAHNSQGLRKYIKESESSLLLYERNLIIFMALFFVSLIARIYMRKKMKRLESPN
jgi:predicted PurR-regulated permease PerM